MKNKQKGDARWSVPFFFYTPMQEVTPKVVAIAVRTVMMMLRILPQIDLFSMVVFKFRISTINCHSVFYDISKHKSIKFSRKGHYDV